jgi:hypothetical protein
MKSGKIDLDDWSVFLQLERDLLRPLPVENPPVTPVRPAEKRVNLSIYGKPSIPKSYLMDPDLDFSSLILALRIRLKVFQHRNSHTFVQDFQIRNHNNCTILYDTLSDVQFEANSAIEKHIFIDIHTQYS